VWQSHAHRATTLYSAGPALTIGPPLFTYRLIYYRPINIKSSQKWLVQNVASVKHRLRASQRYRDPAGKTALLVSREIMVKAYRAAKELGLAGVGCLIDNLPGGGGVLDITRI